MFSWLSVLLAVVGGLHNYSGCKVPSHVSIGQSGQTRHCIRNGSHWGEGSNYFPGSGVPIQQRKKMLESQTLQEEIDKHAVLYVSWSWHLEYAVKFQNSRNKDTCRSGFISDSGWHLVERRTVCPTWFSVSKAKNVSKISLYNIIKLCSWNPIKYLKHCLSAFV